MWTDALIAYLHFAAIFTLLWFFAKEWTLFKAGPEKLDANRLALADAGIGLSAMAVAATGMTRALAGIKPWVFYSHNPVFLAKVGIFILISLISIVPTKAFLRWRKAARADAAFRPDPAEWRRMRVILMIELHLLALLPLLAAMMSRGIGWRG
jgi:putative membrane protein